MKDLLTVGASRYRFGGDDFDRLRPVRRRTPSLVRTWQLRRLTRAYRVLVLNSGNPLVPLFLLSERLFPSRRPAYVVLLHFIPPTSKPAGLPLAQSLAYEVKQLYLRFVVAPVIRRIAVVVQVLTAHERDRLAGFFALPPGVVARVPLPLTDAAAAPPPVRAGSGVLAAGRASCDWPTVFAVAEHGNWPLTVICDERDRSQVERLNRSGRATVHVDIPKDQYREHVASAAVFLMALREDKVSSGQIRVGDCARAGVPLVVSDTIGVREYVRDGATALTFPPGDVECAAQQLDRVLADPGLGRRLAAAAFSEAGAWTAEQATAALLAAVDAQLAAVGTSV